MIGPTGVGKTSVSIELAKKLGCEIISCDSRQLYKELLIGTAPPSKQQLLKIKHHFIQNISIKNNYNVGKYEKEALNKISKIHQKTDTIIAVGGSGLYVDAICKGFDLIPDVSNDIRSKLIKDYEEKGLQWLNKEVEKKDPLFYKYCDKKNYRRLLRALEVYESSEKPISSFRKKRRKKRMFEITKIGLNKNRSTLYNDIEKRVDKMIDLGLVDEVRSLTSFRKHNALQTVGYKEIFEYFDKKKSLKEAINQIKMNSRRYAKRQITWFNKDKNIKWYEPNQIHEIIRFIEQL